MQPDPNTPQTVNRTAATTYDEGLRTHFQRVYNTMAIGLGVTGLVAFFIASSPAMVALLFGTPLKWVMVFAPLAFIFLGFNQRTITTKSVGWLTGMFYLFSGVFGMSLATIFLVYSNESIARVFFITAGMFAVTSIFAYTTKRDLSKMGSLLMMGVIGLLLAMVVNLFLHSSMLQFVISGIGVLVYTGLVAWDTQNIKETYHGGSSAEANNKMAVMGALSLYINFIMLFQFMMQFMGNRQ